MTLELLFGVTFKAFRQFSSEKIAFYEKYIFLAKLKNISLCV
jgi:hypothetical protein